MYEAMVKEAYEEIVGFENMEKIAKADPLKKGYIARQTIKSGLKGAIGGGLAAGMFPIGLTDVVHNPSKKKIIATALTTAAGAAIGGKWGVEKAYPEAITNRVWANLTQKEKDKIDANERRTAHLYDTWSNIDDEIDRLPGDGEGTKAQQARLDKLWEMRRKVEEKIEADPDNMAEYRAWNRSAEDLVNRGLLKKKPRRNAFDYDSFRKNQLPNLKVKEAYEEILGMDKRASLVGSQSTVGMHNPMTLGRAVRGDREGALSGYVQRKGEAKRDAMIDRGINRIKQGGVSGALGGIGNPNSLKSVAGIGGMVANKTAAKKAAAYYDEAQFMKQAAEADYAEACAYEEAALQILDELGYLD